LGTARRWFARDGVGYTSKEMPEPAAELFSMDLPCDPRAPRAVRDALDRSEDIGCVLGDATLVATELVTNAVRHSGCSARQTLEVRVDVRPERLRISVRDPGRSGREAEVRSGQTVGGWGLQIVEQLAERWGSERAEGYQVWAEIGML
jgi:anti-sigma regulatory factor (Ser/Thr protein kinase)